MDPKIGVYICTGCDIGKSLEIDKLEKIATDNKAVVVKSLDALCHPDQIQTIHNDIKENELNKIVIAACSQRYFTESFDFGNTIFTERANLREQVVWCHEPNDEDTQMHAEDIIRMGITKVRLGEPPEPYQEKTSKDILVIGGGISGMTAAKSAALAGYKVTLVEKEEQLGGWAAKYNKVFPTEPPYTELVESDYQDLINDITANSNITIHTKTTVAKTAGQPGAFTVTLKNGSAPTDIKVGSIIQASGWKAYDKTKLTKWGYGVSPDVITNIEMEELASKGQITRPSDGKAPKSIAFIQCAGSRDKDHLPYCSTVCCRVALKQAMYVQEQNPDTKIYILYKDMRSPAQFEQFYEKAQTNENMFLTKGEIQVVEKGSNGEISIKLNDTLFGNDITINADMAVLATGMVPTTKVDEEGETADQPAEEQAADGGKEMKAAEAAEKGAKILNLTYRQGTDLPTLKYGFPDSHFICFPFETRRTAIYTAGCVRAPMDTSSAKNDAYGAALKAVQAVEALSEGRALHPRAGDLSVPNFNIQKCTQCKRCTEECPFGTLDEDVKGTPLPNPLRCRRCGICLGACPERIISFTNYNVNMMSKIVQSINVPDEFEEKPRIIVFACENDAIPAIEIAGIKKMKYNAMIRIIPLRCLGSMNIVWANDALASGFDGIMLLGCKKGDDYQCHFIQGSELANTRISNVREKLKQLVLEEERVEFHEIAHTDYDKIPKLFDDFLEVIERVGPNPYKDM